MEQDKIYDDKKAWKSFEGEDESETIGVYARCLECGKFLKRGEVLMNGLGEIKLKNWICNKHNEVQPYWERFENY